MKEAHRFATLAVHAGETPCPRTGALDTPIYQSTTFVSADSDEMAAVYGEEKFGYMYTRYGNPTIHALEEKIAALEGGEAALAFALRDGGDFLGDSRLRQSGRPRGGGAVALRRGLQFPQQETAAHGSLDHLRALRAWRISRRPSSPTRA